MAKTTFGEEVYLRALTGRYVGEYVLRDYTDIAVISPKNIICNSISAAAEATFVSKTGGRAIHLIAEPGNASEIVQKLDEFQPEAVVLMFGGETPIEETKRLFMEVVKELAARDIYTDIVVHVRIFAAGGLAEAVHDKEIREYLLEQTVMVYTVDLDNGLFKINVAQIDETGELALEKIEQYVVSVEHAELLNRSLRDKTVKWVEA